MRVPALALRFMREQLTAAVFALFQSAVTALIMTITDVKIIPLTAAAKALMMQLSQEGNAIMTAAASVTSQNSKI